LVLLLLLLLLGMSAGEIAISDDPRAQKIYEGFRMCVVQPAASVSTVSFSGLSALSRSSGHHRPCVASLRASSFA